MYTEKPKGGIPKTTHPLIGFLLMVIALAAVAFAVGARPLNTNCGTLAEESSGCAITQPNQPATLTRSAEELILTKAVYMVMPTTTPTAQPTSVPTTPAPTQRVPRATRTPVNSISMAVAPIIALPQCELSRMLDGRGSLVEKLDTYYESAGGPNNRIARGATLNGPTVFWMEVGANQSVPENVIPLSIEGSRSVFLIRDGAYTITIGEGGRYISLIVENECPLVE